LIGTVAIESFEEGITGLENIELFSDQESFVGELQHLYSSNRFSLQSGAGYLYNDSNDIFIFNPFPAEEDETAIRNANIYSYSQLKLPHNIIATIGLSADFFENEFLDIDSEEINPKLGITWQLTGSTLLRGAVFKAVRRFLINSQTIEPTHVAGFNQFFDDDIGSFAWSYGIGIDHKFSNTLFGGAQFLKRDLNVPYLQADFDTGILIPEEDDWREQIGSGYIYWAPARWMSLGLEYFYEDFDQEENFFGAIFGINGVTNHRIVPQVGFFHRCGFSARIWASYVDQKRDFDDDFISVDAKESDQFWQVDAALSYRLPKRYGIVSLVAKNLFDEEFNYIDTDPANPKFLPEQQVFLTLTVNL
jgi:outer membrane receptor protein involved in Fe transport